jgi:hypothetical protein
MASNWFVTLVTPFGVSTRKVVMMLVLMLLVLMLMAVPQLPAFACGMPTSCPCPGC